MGVSELHPGEPAFRAFESAFARAAEASGDARRLSLEVAGLRVVMEFASEALARRMGAPFSHLLCDDGPADLTIRAWDSESTGIQLPAEFPSPGSVYERSLPAMSETDEIRWAYFRPDPGLTAFDRTCSRGVYWVPAASALTYGDLAGGFRAMFAWGLAPLGLQFLHSAAVGTGGRGALIVGASGSGKSSTALACLLEGMDYLGDDHCLLDLPGEPLVHAVYGAAKLHTEQARRFPELAEYVVNPDRVAPEKAVAMVYPAFDGQLPRSLPLVAVFVPRISGDTKTRIEPLARGAALAALAPSTLLQMASADRAALAAMGQLVRRVPCYQLTLGTERAEIAATIRVFLESNR